MPTQRLAARSPPELYPAHVGRHSAFPPSSMRKMRGRHPKRGTGPITRYPGPLPLPTSTVPHPLRFDAQDEDPEEEEHAASILRWAREDAQPSGWQPTDEDMSKDLGKDTLASSRKTSNWSCAVGGDGGARNSLYAKGSAGSRPACGRVSTSLTAERLAQLTRMRSSMAARRSNRTLILH